MSQGITLLGSTGTIGKTALSLIERFPDKFHVVGLAAGKNINELRGQISRFRPRIVSVTEHDDYYSLQSEFPDLEIHWGPSGCLRCASDSEAGLVIIGIVGFAALEPTLSAIRAGHRIAIANKETLVVAGPLIREEIRRRGVHCIPVDSEHNALFQLLEGRPRDTISSLVLTASGGPLLRRPDLPLQDVTPALATSHPNWKMGPKISVDSATLMNKGLELIEAHYLFEIPESEIEVWIHPQSILHGAVWLKDNTCLAQLSKPDMRSSIGFAMNYPERLLGPIPKLSFQDISRLEFSEPDSRRFPALQLARDALRSGPSHLIWLNAANEIAVDCFLKGRLLFSDIPRVIETILTRHHSTEVTGLEPILEEDRKARTSTLALVSGMGR